MAFPFPRPPLSHAVDWGLEGGIYHPATDTHQHYGRMSAGPTSVPIVQRSQRIRIPFEPDTLMQDSPGAARDWKRLLWAVPQDILAEEEQLQSVACQDLLRGGLLDIRGRTVVAAATQSSQVAMFRMNGEGTSMTALLRGSHSKSGIVRQVALRGTAQGSTAMCVRYSAALCVFSSDDLETGAEGLRMRFCPPQPPASMCMWDAQDNRAQPVFLLTDPDPGPHACIMHLYHWDELQQQESAQRTSVALPDPVRENVSKPWMYWQLASTPHPRVVAVACPKLFGYIDLRSGSIVRTLTPTQVPFLHHRRHDERFTCVSVDPLNGFPMCHALVSDEHLLVVDQRMASEPLAVVAHNMSPAPTSVRQFDQHLALCRCEDAGCAITTVDTRGIVTANASDNEDHGQRPGGLGLLPAKKPPQRPFTTHPSFGIAPPRMVYSGDNWDTFSHRRSSSANHGHQGADFDPAVGIAVCEGSSSRTEHTSLSLYSLHTSGVMSSRSISLLGGEHRFEYGSSSSAGPDMAHSSTEPLQAAHSSQEATPVFDIKQTLSKLLSSSQYYVTKHPQQPTVHSAEAPSAERTPSHVATTAQEAENGPGSPAVKVYDATAAVADLRPKPLPMGTATPKRGGASLATLSQSLASPTHPLATSFSISVLSQSVDDGMQDNPELTEVEQSSKPTSTELLCALADEWDSGAQAHNSHDDRRAMESSQLDMSQFVPQVMQSQSQSQPQFQTPLLSQPTLSQPATPGSVLLSPFSQHLSPRQPGSQDLRERRSKRRKTASQPRRKGF